jgi:hypothetical protein
MRYLILRACERVDPRAVYGRPWDKLSFAEQKELLAFEWLRAAENG